MPVPAPAARWGVLILPKIIMPTPAVYRKFDQMQLGDSDAVTTSPDWPAWAKLPAKDLLPRLVNNLERPAFEICPELGELRSRIESELKRPVRMSGSGSSLFTLFDDRSAADHAARVVSVKENTIARTVEISPRSPEDLNTDAVDRY